MASSIFEGLTKDIQDKLNPESTTAEKLAALEKQVQDLTSGSTTTTTTTGTSTGGFSASGETTGIPNPYAVQTPEQQVATREDVLTNVTSPQIPESGVQTYTALQDTADQFADPNDPRTQIGEVGAPPAATGTTSTAQVTGAQAASYIPNEITGQTPVVDAATTAVDKLVDPVTGKLTKEATAATGKVDPNSLVQAAVGSISEAGTAQPAVEDLPTQALMSTQLNELLKGLEGGNVPTWARPAVDAVESMLQARGLSRSSIGRDNLFNAIIQSALPIAQENARAEQQRASQNLSNKQQTALFNAQNVIGMDMANLNNEQQARLMNSQAFQTMTLTNLNNKQQAAMQNAAAWAAMDTANLNAAMTAQVENARNFLQINMANLNNEQQAALVNQQAKLQTLLSDQASINAARQFNAANETQVSTFMAQLGTQVSQFNATQANAMEQFNAGQVNAMEQFNANIAFSRDQFNAQMYNAIEQSNIQWRRQMNQIDTAGINAVNQANAINAFNLSNQALTFLWQDLRDSASWAFQASENDQERDTRMAIAALSNEAEKDKLTVDTWATVGAFVTKLLG